MGTEGPDGTAPIPTAPPEASFAACGSRSIGFIVGLGLASLTGQRTGPVILLVVLELILTPIFSRAVIADIQRAIVGVAMLHIEPGNLPTPFSGGGPGGGGGGWAGRCADRSPPW